MTRRSKTIFRSPKRSSLASQPNNLPVERRTFLWFLTYLKKDTRLPIASLYARQGLHGNGGDGAVVQLQHPCADVTKKNGNTRLNAWSPVEADPLQTVGFDFQCGSCVHIRNKWVLDWVQCYAKSDPPNLLLFNIKPLLQLTNAHTKCTL